MQSRRPHLLYAAPESPDRPGSPLAPFSPLLPGAPLSPLSPLSMFCVVTDVPATPGGPLDPGAPGCPSFPGAPGIPSLPVRYKLAYSQNTHVYWRHQKMKFLLGNSLSFVFLPIHLLFPISTGVVFSFILVPLSTVQHKYLLFSRKVDHLQGPK